MAQAFQHDDTPCQQDPQANAAWLDWGGEALDDFESTCTRLANHYRLRVVRHTNRNPECLSGYPDAVVISLDVQRCNA